MDSISLYLEVLMMKKSVTISVKEYRKLIRKSIQISILKDKFSTEEYVSSNEIKSILGIKGEENTND